MTAPTVHIIQKVFIEVDAPDMDTARSLQSRLGNFMQESVFPELEQELIRLSMKSQLRDIRIEQLNVTGSIKNDSDIHKILKAISREISTSLGGKLDGPDQAAHVLDGTERYHEPEILFHFLEFGTLPWWHSNTVHSEDLVKIIETYQGWEKYRQRLVALLGNSKVRDRLSQQFLPETSIKLLKHSFPDSTLLFACEEGFNKLGSPPLNSRRKFWKTLYDVLSESFPAAFSNFLVRQGQLPGAEYSSSEADQEYWKDFNDILALAIGEQGSETTWKDISSASLDPTSEPLPEPTGIVQNFYVANAGLILIHPFLVPLFEAHDLLNADRQIKDVDLAVHLLHYAATKRECDWEHAMTFEKFLCGIPLDEPISREVVLSVRHKNEIEGLLNSVLSNWEVLKAASTDLLRNEFLQRQGKISFKAKYPKVVVEGKPQDILMNKIPWTIGVCKLPWLDSLIFTDWN